MNISIANFTTNEKKNGVKSLFCLIHLETMYRVLTFDVTTAAWQALGYLVVTRESMEAFAVGGMRRNDARHR